MLKRIAILANGGDCSGFNAVIRAIVKTCRKYGIEAYGFLDGFNGLLNNNFVELAIPGRASGILQKGGSIIGSSLNSNVFNYKVEENGEVFYKDLSQKCIDNIYNDRFDCLFMLGGDSTSKAARDFFVRGVNVIAVPKTIDNDVACTEITFGYNTAVTVAAEAIDRLHSTAETHNRILTLEVMGRNAGWIALESAIAGGADAALIPEIPFDINKVADTIKARQARGSNFAIVVVGEGARPLNGEISVKEIRDGGAGVINTQLGGIGEKVAKQLEELTGLVARNTTLGYMQRGGTPTPFDRVLSTKYGAKAMELAMNGEFGRLVTINDGRLNSVTLEEVVGKNKEVGAVGSGTLESNARLIPEDHDLIKTARSIGICLGD